MGEWHTFQCTWRDVGKEEETKSAKLTVGELNKEDINLVKLRDITRTQTSRVVTLLADTESRANEKASMCAIKE